MREIEYCDSSVSALRTLFLREELLAPVLDALDDPLTGATAAYWLSLACRHHNDTAASILAFACRTSRLTAAKFINAVYPHALSGDSVKFACRRATKLGHASILHWLHSVTDIGLGLYGAELVSTAAQHGHIELARWLIERIKEDEDAEWPLDDTPANRKWIDIMAQHGLA